jgi:hypothetical protein
VISHWRIERETLWGGRHCFVRRFLGFARLSFWKKKNRVKQKTVERRETVAKTIGRGIRFYKLMLNCAIRKIIWWLWQKRSLILMNLRRGGCMRSAQKQTELGSNLNICSKTGKQRNQWQDGRSQVLPDARWHLPVQNQKNMWDSVYMCPFFSNKSNCMSPKNVYWFLN